MSELIKLNTSPDNKKIEISFDAKMVADVMRDLSSKTATYTRTKENFVQTFITQITKISEDINNPNTRTNAMSAIRDINTSYGLESDAHVERLLRWLDSPALWQYVSEKSKNNKTNTSKMDNMMAVSYQPNEKTQTSKSHQNDFSLQWTIDTIKKRNDLLKTF